MSGKLYLSSFFNDVCNMKTLCTIFSLCLVAGVVNADSSENCFAPKSMSQQEGGSKFSPLSFKHSLKSRQYNLFDGICGIKLNDRKLKNNTAILLDVRSKAEYGRYRINNSINISLSQIKIKNFWKNKLLVLINNGHDIQPLINECGQLRKKGFKKIFVFKNGIDKWSRNKNLLIGKYSSMDLKGIRASQLFADRDLYNWVVISAATDAHAKQLARLSDYFSSIVQYSNFKENNYPGKTRFIFVDNIGGQFTLFDKIKAENKFYLHGGVDKFAEFIFKQYKMTNKKEFTLQKPKSCK